MTIRFSFRGLLLALVALSIAVPVAAQTTPANAPTPSPGYGLINPLGPRSVPGLLGDAIAWMGGLAGSLFLAYLIWGGVNWMTAGGNGKKVEQAQAKIVSSIIGIVAVLLGYLAIATVIGIVPR